MKKIGSSFIAISAAVFLMGAAPPPPPDPDTVDVRTEELAPGVAVIFGAGGNIGVSHGSDGNVLIDDQFSTLTPKITAAVAELNPNPIRFVINTHWHFDHAGGNENFGKAGSVIVAHDNVRTRMSTDQVIGALNYDFPPSPKEALPVVTFAEGVTFHLNEDVLQVVHVAAAHTDGDAFVKWEEANVLHTGDVFNRSGAPFIDRSSGGTAAGLSAAMDVALSLADENTKVIPGHGPVGTRADMVAYRDELNLAIARVTSEYNAGKSLQQILELEIQWTAAASGPVHAGRLVEAIYQDLEAASE